jgi:hypothetical protein
VEAAQDKFDTALKDARLAEAAHLDALAVLKDGKALRLDHLRSKILQGLPVDHRLHRLMDLRFAPGESPRLFLDLTTSVAMGADGRSFELQQDREGDRIMTYETPDAEAMFRQILKVQAHQYIAETRNAQGADVQAADGNANGAEWISILYVWLTGFIFGASALAAWSMYTGKLGF